MALIILTSRDRGKDAYDKERAARQADGTAVTSLRGSYRAGRVLAGAQAEFQTCLLWANTLSRASSGRRENMGGLGSSVLDGNDRPVRFVPAKTGSQVPQGPGW